MLPSVAAIKIAEWLNSVPYHGTFPETSLESVDPIAETTTTANGPPNTMAAMIGAALTETTVPRGSRTGIELPMSAKMVQ